VVSYVTVLVLSIWLSWHDQLFMSFLLVWRNCYKLPYLY